MFSFFNVEGISGELFFYSHVLHSGQISLFPSNINVPFCIYCTYLFHSSYFYIYVCFVNLYIYFSFTDNKHKNTNLITLILINVIIFVVVCQCLHHFLGKTSEFAQCGINYILFHLTLPYMN